MKNIILITLLFTNFLNHSISQTIDVPANEITDKIRGGLLGQNLGVLNGLQYEFKFNEEPGNISGYIPSLPEGARTDDDTDFEWVYIYTMHQNNKVFLSQNEISNLWQERINKNVWCANRYARHLMDIGIYPPYTGMISLNPWAEFNISGQFLCETFGLIAPGMPQTASKIGLNYTRVAIDYEPAQTTQFFCSMIATAFFVDDINKILEAGYISLDENSIIHKITDDVKAWYKQYPDDWKKTRKALYEKYEQDSWLRSFNGHELNTGAIIAALLYGNGDFVSSIQHAFNFGFDADCNAATVGTIIGTMKGYKWMMSQGWQIVDRYKNTTRDNMPMDETITSFADRLIDLFELINNKNGGKRYLSEKGVMFSISTERPAPVIKLHSFEEQTENLKNDLKTEIIENVKSATKESQARGAYLAICLGLNKEIIKSLPKEWEAACIALKGYWKIMNNIFYGGDFTRMDILEKRFIAAGFKAPKKEYTTYEIYNDNVVWKELTEIYQP